jgi:DNA replication protein DnaC
VRFFNAADLVNRLEREKQQGKAGNLARQLIQIDAVTLGELGYLPFPGAGGALLFRLASQLYEKTSLIITANLNFGEWAQVFGDAKMTAALHPPLRHPRNRQRLLPLQAAQTGCSEHLKRRFNWKKLDGD